MNKIAEPNFTALDTLSQLYLSTTGSKPDTVKMLPGAGSGRKYYRLSASDYPTLIGVEGTDKAENRAFITLSKHFCAKGLPMPLVVAVSDDGMCYLQEDLGDRSLYEFIASGRERGEWTDEQRLALLRTITALPSIQWEGAQGLNFDAVCFPVGAMDRQAVMWDLNYFKYCFLKAAGINHSEPLLERDFAHLCDMVAQVDTPTFMYRDLQSRNVLLTHDLQPRFIDFQGGRRGPIHYDVVSMLWQAKARIPQWLKDNLIEAYIEASAPYITLDRAKFREELRLFVLLRTLQVLGAYGLRGLVERKPHFLNSIPDAVANLRELLDQPLPHLPHLIATLRRIADDPRWLKNDTPAQGLTVRVNSFGFRKSGIPRDDTPNGGGFVFDCRALANPGRYAEYKKLTGRDLPVIEYLERDGGIVSFLDHAYALVDNAVDNYLDRGFTDLMVSFGCTGGQHRSVYSAEHMARHLSEKYGITVLLNHREQGISETLPSRR